MHFTNAKELQVSQDLNIEYHSTSACQRATASGY